MTLRTRATAWAVLPALGLLSWSATGCHSEAPSTAAAAPEGTALAPAPSTAVLLPTPGADSVPIAAGEPPATIPAIPGMNANDVSPDRIDPLPGRSYVDQEVRRVDVEVNQTARKLENSLQQKGQATVERGLKRAEDEVNKGIGEVIPGR